MKKTGANGVGMGWIVTENSIIVKFLVSHISN
jgi:hypothetical protein